MKKCLIAQGIKKKAVLQNPRLIEAPTYRIGLKKKALSILELEHEMKDVQNKMQEYSKNLEPGAEVGLFIGVAIVVLTL